jgi:hypothetical protein
MMGLLNYAEFNGGEFPSGGKTPEDSLRKLYPEYADATMLRGRIVPLRTVQESLEKGQPLGPETCGWHYVEGLRKDDDPRLAIFWDKVGLGHNGERLQPGGHTVFFVNGLSHYVEPNEWDGFLKEQQRLLATRKGVAQ